jgi:hypothetical protein
MLCEPDAKNVCRFCSKNLRVSEYRECETRLTKIVRLKCPYLGQSREGDLVVIRALCPGCNGTKKWNETANIVHDCAKFGRCLPTYRCAKTAIREETVSGDDSAKPCLTCELNPANQTLPDTEGR